MIAQPKMITQPKKIIFIPRISEIEVNNLFDEMFSFVVSTIFCEHHHEIVLLVNQTSQL